MPVGLSCRADLDVEGGLRECVGQIDVCRIGVNLKLVFQHHGDGGRPFYQIGSRGQIERVFGRVYVGGHGAMQAGAENDEYQK